jgi:hypothetical protein
MAIRQVWAFYKKNTIFLPNQSQACGRLRQNGNGLQPNAISLMLQLPEQDLLKVVCNEKRGGSEKMAVVG